MKPSWGLIFWILAAFLLCEGVGFAQDSQGDPKNGQRIFQEHCSRCHGLNGSGDGPDAAYLTVPPANLQSERSRMKSDLELLMTIAHGSIYSPMHGWRDRLSESEMRDVLAYIRLLAPFQAIARSE